MWVITLLFGIIGIAWIFTQIFYYQPRLTKLNNIEHDFAVVNDYYDVVEISKAIPVPSPLGTYKNLDYLPIALYKNNPQNTVIDFSGAPYGYVLKLSTGINTYLATADPVTYNKNQVLYTIGQIRENRLRFRWFIYNGPLPPPEWISSSN
jgi:hypothetical protein